jgi:hypothetical protein
VYVFLDPWKEAFEGMWALEISFSLCAESVVVLSNPLFAGSLFPLNVLLRSVLFLACYITPHLYIHSLYVRACDELSVAYPLETECCNYIYGKFISTAYQ